MSIRFDATSKTFKLDTVHSSYLLRVHETGRLLQVYYGTPIPDATVSDRDQRRGTASFSPNDPHGPFTPDGAPMEYGCNGAGDFRISALSVRNANGDSTTDVRYKDYRIYAGKNKIPGLPATYVNSETEADTLEIDMEDPVTGVVATLCYSVFHHMGVITRNVKITNGGSESCRLERAMSLCVDLPSMNYDMITLYGRHVRERNYCRRPLARGIQGVESKRGSSSHTQNPFTALVARNADEDYGECYGFNLVYSSNFTATAECDFNATTRFIMGINPTDFSWKLDPGETFHTPEAVMVYTNQGMGEMSRIFHRFYNNHLVRGPYKNAKRPLLINSWEGALFDFDTDKLVAFADEAAKLGMEMLVMDDGWFGVRNDDTTSLGDWFVNEKKLPGGLSNLIRQVNERGLKFGIWFEPEMISPDSNLFRAHPDWHIHVQGREAMIGRTQYVLDFSRPEVVDNIWNQMYAILANNKIDYVKWDFNRNIADAASAALPAERQSEFFHRFVLGTYELMDRLVTTFPHILLENCSGGGGRFDAGMLYYSPQIWTSDNTDAVDRVFIQYGTSLCYPTSTMGAHVSAARRTPFSVRGDVALWGSFGYELDPRKMTQEEKDMVKAQIVEYHKYYDVIHYGDLYRLLCPWDDHRFAVWQFVSQDKNEALVTKVTLDNVWDHFQIVRLRGLDPNKTYRCEELNLTCSGALLMNAGINMTEIAPWSFGSAKLYFRAVEN